MSAVQSLAVAPANASLAGMEGGAVSRAAAIGPEVRLPDGEFLRTADYFRAGGDLVLRAEGQTFLVEDFFRASSLPALVADDGSRIAGDLALALAMANAPVELAQAAGAAAGQAIGQIKSATGGVTATRGGQAVTLATNAPVFQGDVVQTAGGGRVTIQFNDGTTFALNANARMVLDRHVYDPATKQGSALVSVVQGAFVFVSGEIAKTDPSQMLVRTPVATIGIRGTGVGGQVRGEGLINAFTVLTGIIALINGVDSVILDQAGASTTVTGSNQPFAPPAILTAQEVAQRFGPIIDLLNQFVSPDQRIDTSRIERGGDQQGPSNPLTPQDGEAPGQPREGSLQDGTVVTTLAGLEALAQLLADFLAEGSLTEEDLLLLAFLIDISDDSLDDFILVFEDEFGAIIFGSSGPDKLFGSSGDDIIFGGDGDDEIFAGPGNDIVDGGPGNDILDGGDGFDFASFDDEFDSLFIDLLFGIVSGTTIGSDSIFGIEGISALNVASVFIFAGAAPSDNIFNFGSPNIGVDYSDSTEPIAVDLLNQVASGADIGTDIFTDVDAYLSSLTLGGGDDVLFNVDFPEYRVFDGLTGTDGIFYDASSEGLIFEIGMGMVSDTSFDFFDFIGDFEIFGGSAFNDEFYGTSLTETFFGQDGADFLVGGPGTDVVFGGAGSDGFYFGGPGDGLDVLPDFAPGVDSILVEYLNFGSTSLAPGTGPLVNGVNFEVLTGYNGANGASSNAVGGLPTFIYDPAAQLLYFDGDGNSSVSTTPLASFSATPTANDIVAINAGL